MGLETVSARTPRAYQLKFLKPICRSAPGHRGPQLMQECRSSHNHNCENTQVRQKSPSKRIKYVFFLSIGRPNRKCQCTTSLCTLKNSPTYILCRTPWRSEPENERRREPTALQPPGQLRCRPAKYEQAEWQRRCGPERVNDERSLRDGQWTTPTERGAPGSVLV